MGTNAVQRGPTADTVGANVKRLREERNLGLRALAGRLADAGRPLTHTALDKIERGTRRVDVDDLMALAITLGVSPLRLLMPYTNTGHEEVQGTCRPSEPAHLLWDVLRAAPFRGTDGKMNYRHCLDSTPSWAVADLGITIATVDFNRETQDGND
jgi:transcriptional regulator with XRE-family HTH domain